MYTEEEKYSSESPRNEETVQDDKRVKMVSSYLTNVEDTRLLIIDAYKWQLTPDLLCVYRIFQPGNGGRDFGKLKGRRKKEG